MSLSSALFSQGPVRFVEELQPQSPNVQQESNLLTNKQTTRSISTIKVCRGRCLMLQDSTCYYNDGSTFRCPVLIYLIQGNGKQAPLVYICDLQSTVPSRKSRSEELAIR
jgi:hypothetical protein